jgi:putative two-component system response regulator
MNDLLETLNPSMALALDRSTAIATSDEQSLPPVAALPKREPKILIVDDEPINVQVARKHLMLAGYGQFVISTDPTEVLTLLEQEKPDLLLLDIMMPRMSGLDLLHAIRDQELHAHLPILILTALDDREIKSQALDSGATDFLTKPVDPTELLPRVRNALALKAHHDNLRDYASELERAVRARTAELEDSRLEIIRCLARAAEYRDNQTGRHVHRVSQYTRIIARQMRLTDEVVELMAQASMLHDVGKIGIPDSILLKPGKLEPEELEFIQRHCGFGKRIFEPMSMDEFRAYASHTTLGAHIIKPCRAPVLDLAARIALTHHEKWDGSGYPLGLAGEDIPLEGRITAVADVFDALSSKRPYKPAFPLDKCFTIMEEGRNKHFDPKVLDAFFARRGEIVRVQIEYADTD